MVSKVKQDELNQGISEAYPGEMKPCETKRYERSVTR